MPITYRLNGNPVPAITAMVETISGFTDAGLRQPRRTFELAKEQSTIGYVCRDLIEDMCPGLTIRHANEEQH